MHDALASLDRWLAHRHGSYVVAITLTLVIIIGYVDFLAGYAISLSVVQLLPIAAAAWYSGRWAGIAMAIVACTGTFVAQELDTSFTAHFAPTLNSMIRLSCFLPFALLISMTRASLEFERRLARTDAISGLSSRHAFEERLDHDLKLARRQHVPLTLAYIDIDDFKTINDRHGHGEGDRVLRAVGVALRRAMRASDTAARIGGDEFAVILLDSERRGADHVLSKFRQELPAALDGSPCRPTFSIGVVSFEKAPLRVDDALRSADALMYDAKRRGRNIVLYSAVEQVNGNGTNGASASAHPQMRVSHLP